MPSLAPSSLASRSSSSTLLATLRQIGEYKERQPLYRRQTPEIQESLKTTALIESSESSNRIEGIVAPRNRVPEIVLETTTPKNRSADRRENRHNIHPWLNYFWGVVLRSCREFEERVGDSRTDRGAKSQLVRDAVLGKSNPFAISDIMRDCPGMSRDTVRVVLRKLRDEGVIEQQGRGRAASWMPTRVCRNPAN